MFERLDHGSVRTQVVSVGVGFFLAQFLIALASQFARYTDPTIFGAFWEAGRHIDYLVHPLVPVSPGGLAEINLNPPALFPIFQFASLFDPLIARTVWFFFSGAAYLWCAWMLRGATSIQILWLLTIPIGFTGMTMGQIYVVLFALGVLAHAQLADGRPYRAAAILGVLIAIKPNFGLWILASYAAGYKREALTAAGVAGTLSIIPAILYGFDIYLEWFAAIATDLHYLYPQDVSLGGLLRRIGVPGSAFLIPAGILLTVAWAFKARPSLYDLTPVALIAAIIFAPLGWQGYALVTLGFMFDRPWRLPMLFAVALVYMHPFAGVFKVLQSPFVASVFYSVTVWIIGAWFLARARRPDSAIPRPALKAEPDMLTAIGRVPSGSGIEVGGSS